MHDKDNRVITSLVEIDGVFIEYFQNLFTSSNLTYHTLKKCVVHVESNVAIEMNA